MNMELGKEQIIKNAIVNGFAPRLEGNTCSLQFHEESLNSNMVQPDMPKLQLLLKQEYDKKLSFIENCSEFDVNRKNQEKLKLLQIYLQQLEEQNDILVTTMTELEREAYLRVQQMEKRLQSSAKSTMEAVLNVHDCEQEMRRLVNEKLHLESIFDNMQHHLSTLQVENSLLRDQNSNLNHDVQALLHIIHHARSTGHWEMDCVTFCELTPEQVFGPVQSLSQIWPSELATTLPERNEKICESSSSCTSTDTDDIDHSKSVMCNLDNSSGTFQDSFSPYHEDFKSSYSNIEMLTFNEKTQIQITHKDVVSTCIQTEECKSISYSIGLQTDIKQALNENKYQNNFNELDRTVMDQHITILKESLLKAEDKIAAKEILIEELKGHLESIMKEVDFKNKNIEEILQEQQMLQDQKRILMIRLDAQGDLLEETKQELEQLKLKVQNSEVHIDQQNQIIRKLQEALVQSKRAFDAVNANKQVLPQNASSNFHNKLIKSSKSSVVDI